MSGKLKLEVTQGTMRGKFFAFDEHDTFIFGRTPECHARFPDDTMVSRHHFILEVNPPDARIRDLGSLNGTYVNDTKYGGRGEDETPEEGAKRKYPEVDLKDGDQIRVGETVLTLRIEMPMVCCQCNCSIADKDREKCFWIGGTFICVSCKNKLAASAQPAKKAEPVRCQKCGKDVSSEIGKDRRGNYICQSCQKKAEADPAELLLQILKQAGKQQDRGAVPSIQGYDIEKRIGIGGMGAVYLAKNKKDHKHVAVKIMLSKVAVDERAREQFKREMNIASSLHHNNIVEFIDDGSAGSAFYFIMEYCDGGGVNDLMDLHGGRLHLDVAGPIMLQSLEGLAYAHKKAFVHRDIKPHNILLCGSGRNLTAKISDFGLAKNFQRAGFSGMTVTGSIAGTPMFMPREQLINFKYTKPVSDVWSLGATFYNMLTGQLTRDFKKGQDPMEVVLQGRIVPIRERDASIPKKLAEVIDRALSNEPSQRFQDATEMLKAMQKVL
jgi:serine/threonine-protein kinase